MIGSKIGFKGMFSMFVEIYHAQNMLNVTFLGPNHM